MSNVTRAAQNLIVHLHERQERNHNLAEEARKEGNYTKAAVHQAWADATQQALNDLTVYVPEIEGEAALVPSHEEDFASLRERLIAEEMAA